MVAANLTKWVAWGPVTVRSMFGWNNNATPVYIQFFQTPTVAASDVPAMKSLVAAGNNGFMYVFGPEGITLSELLVALSTTELNYTAVSAASGLDMTLDIDSQFACDGTEVVVGDLTTGQNTLQVWTEAAGLSAPKRLLRVDVKNNQATDTLVNLVYAVDTVVPGSLVAAFNKCPISVTTTTYYGDAQGGFQPFQQDANYTQHRGCTINISALVAGFWTAGTLYGGTSPNVRAIYKPV